MGVGPRVVTCRLGRKCRSGATNQHSMLAYSALHLLAKGPRAASTHLQGSAGSAAMCAGHIAAAQLAAAAAAASFAEPGPPDPYAESTLATVLPLVACALPEAVGPELLEPFDSHQAGTHGGWHGWQLCLLPLQPTSLRAGSRCGRKATSQQQCKAGDGTQLVGLTTQ